MIVVWDVAQFGRRPENLKSDQVLFYWQIGLEQRRI